MRMLCLFVFALAATVAQAQPYPSSCWVLEDMSGTSMMKDDRYEASKDRFSQPITLLLNGENSSATGDSIRLHQVDPHMAVGFNKTDTFTTNESYLVDPETGTAIYTKAVSVKGVMAGVTGARLFKGKARRCR